MVEAYATALLVIEEPQARSLCYGSPRPGIPGRGVGVRGYALVF